MSSDAPLPTEVGRYHVDRLLGHGAMGRVFLARDGVLDRDVAIKVLRQDLGLAPGQHGTLLDRMRQEARASARLLHPNIVALFDMGEDPELGLYLVFEYVEGPTLRDAIDGGRLGPSRAAKIARELGHALTTAHSAGILHRDIKPENVILAKQGAKIADFGIARIPGSTLTRDGGVLGTPAYSAPEAIESGTFSPASDQFSLAATLYEALSATRAFPGDDAISVSNRIMESEPDPVAEKCGLDPHVDRVLARALDKNPSRRFSSAEDFGQALAEALGLSATRAALPTLPDTEHTRAADEESERRQLVAAGIGAVVGGLVVAALFLLWPSTAGEPTATPASPTSTSARVTAAPALEPTEAAPAAGHETRSKSRRGGGVRDAAEADEQAPASPEPREPSSLED
jgi:serine/threonine protein kinase